MKIDDDNYPQRILELRYPQMQGEDVLEVQRRLIGLNYLVTPNGIFSEDTKRTIEYFQMNFGLVQTGKVDTDVLEALRILDTSGQPYLPYLNISAKLGMSEAVFNRILCLSEPGVILQPMQQKDFIKYNSVYGPDPMKADYMKYDEPPATIEENLRSFQWRVAKMHHGHPISGLSFLIYDTNQVLMGFCSIHNLSSPAEIGYTVLQQHAGKQVATKAARIMLRILSHSANFDIGVAKACADARNGASRRVMEKCGFYLVDSDAQGDVTYQRALPFVE